MWNYRKQHQNFDRHDQETVQKLARTLYCAYLDTEVCGGPVCTMTGNMAGNVGQIKVLKNMPRMDEALTLLKKLHSLCKPIQKKYGWYLPELVEFFPENPGLLGMNINQGQKIFIRLRPHYDKNTFLPLEESLVGTLLHELTHNVHGPHDKNFYAFLDKLQDEYDALRASGYSGEGFLSDGERLGVSHNLPSHLGRIKALEEAERRQKIAKIMGPVGGRSLGGSGVKTGKSPRELMAEAAERRARDAKSCGHGEGIADIKVQEEMKKAEEDSIGVFGSSLSLNNEVSEASSEVTSASGTQTESESDSGSSDIEIITPLPKSLPSKTAHRTPTATKPNSVLGKRLDRVISPPSLAVTSTEDTTRLQGVWTCAHCTVENEKPHGLVCEVCESPRFEQNPSARGTTAPPYGHGLVKPHRSTSNTSSPRTWVCHLCGGETSHDFWTCHLCGTLKLNS